MPHNWSEEADSHSEPGGIYHMLDRLALHHLELFQLDPVCVELYWPVKKVSESAKKFKARTPELDLSSVVHHLGCKTVQQGRYGG